MFLYPKNLTSCVSYLYWYSPSISLPLRMPFLEGYIVGLALVILVGPVLFTLLQITLQFGVKSGLAVAFGIFVSDVLCVVLCAFGAAKWLREPDNFFYFGLLGGVLLILFGLTFLLKPAKNFEQPLQISKRDYLTFFTKGFLVNFVNPFVFLVWISIIGMAAAKHGFNQILAVYMTGALLGILTTDSLKALFADRLKRILKPTFLGKFYRIVGLCLLLFGVFLIYRSYFQSQSALDIQTIYNVVLIL